MTTLRKWRFPILIGSGLIAAGALVYFSNGRVNTSKTQGAIGQRDVYREGQVNSADVAKPGSAPVATEAILQSNEFKALAKNAAFQEVLHNDAFNELGRKSNFADLLADTNFRKLAQDAQFRQLLKSEVFNRALDQGLKQDRLTAALRNDAHYAALIDTKAFDAMMQQWAAPCCALGFKSLAQSHELQGLLASASFQAVLRDQSFALLAARQDSGLRSNQEAPRRR